MLVASGVKVSRKRDERKYSQADYDSMMTRSADEASA